MFPAGLAAIYLATTFTLQGQITTDRVKPTVLLVLEDPKARPMEIARTMPDNDGKYTFAGLTGRNYRLLATIAGKKQERRDIEIFCRSGAIVSKDFHYGKTPATLMLSFPGEDPDFIDVAELAGEYSREVLRDYDRGKEDHLNGNIARAVLRLESVAERAPGMYGVHARLGMIFQQTGCYSDAEAEYTRASALSPRSVQPLLNLASAQIRAADVPGQFESSLTRALETLGRVLEARPKSAVAHCLIGAARVRLEAYDDAEKSFLRALDLDSSLSAAQLMLANVYIHRKKWDEAIKQLQDYLEDQPYAPDRSVVKDMLASAARKRSEP